MKKTAAIVFWLLLWPVLVWAGGAQGPLLVSAEPWPEADGLFRNDPRWLGADDAYSVDLGQGRVLWLFGDTFISSPKDSERSGAAVIRNSLAIQKGYNPAEASLEFFWKDNPDGPAPFFPDLGRSWHWPGGGVRLDEALIIFLMKIKPTEGPLGFAADGFSAVRITDPDRAPQEWSFTLLQAPPNNFNVIVGSASVFYDQGFVYAYGAAEDADHGAYLVRWPAGGFKRGDLSDPRWWTGRDWVRQKNLTAKPPPLFTNGQNEFSVHYSPRLGGYLQIQTFGFGAAELGFRRADAATGPWSEPVMFHQPLPPGDPRLIVYAGKAHPELTGADLVLTYVVNSTDWDYLLENNDIYYPKFLKGTFRAE